MVQKRNKIVEKRTKMVQKRNQNGTGNRTKTVTQKNGNKSFKINSFFGAIFVRV